MKHPQKCSKLAYSKNQIIYPIKEKFYLTKKKFILEITTQVLRSNLILLIDGKIIVSAENHDRRDSSASAQSDSASLSENNPKPINPDTVGVLLYNFSRENISYFILRFHCLVYQYVRSIHINHLKQLRLFPHQIFVVVWKKALKKIQAQPPISLTQMIPLHVR